MTSLTLCVMASLEINTITPFLPVHIIVINCMRYIFYFPAFPCSIYFYSAWLTAFLEGLASSMYIWYNGIDKWGSLHEIHNICRFENDMLINLL